jgi:8-oxo-dGTP diphosphatase
MADKIGIRAATVTIKDNKVLLVNSKYDDGEYYLFPGGGVEHGETIREAAIRETLEETGINIDIKKVLHINEFIYRNNWDKRSITIFFLSEVNSKDEREVLDDEGKIKEVVWVDLKDLEKIDIRPKILVKILKSKSDLNNLDYSIDFK